MKTKSMQAMAAAFAAAAVLSAAGAEYDFVSATEAPFKMPDVPVWRIPAREFPITGYGAESGGKAKCSEAFKKAIAACSASGGGRVVVPAGEWLTGAIHLRSNVALDLREGAKLVFTDDPADYLPAVHTNWEGVEALGYSPLIYAYCCTNVAIVGRGTIAPKTGLWRKWGNRNTSAHKAFIRTLYDWCSKGVPLAKRDITRIEGSHARPHLIQFNRSANILLEGFRIRQSPFWTMHVFHSENVVVRKLDVYAHGHNNDGIDIDMTRNVIVEDCVFDQGDDAIILKAARNHDAWALARSTENVVVRRCTVKDGHVLFGAGSDVSGGIRNVLMHDCRMTGVVQNVFYVKTNERRGGFVENIYMKDCSVTTRGKRTPQSVVGVETDVLYEWRNLPTYDVRLTRIRNVVAENVRVDRCKHLLMVYGDARAEVDGVTLRNVTSGKVVGERCIVVNAKNVTVDGRAVESRPGKAPAR